MHRLLHCAISRLKQSDYTAGQQNALHERFGHAAATQLAKNSTSTQLPKNYFERERDMIHSKNK
jgi:hypothetical protein